jgi:phenylacetic acid degradation protein PaaD
VRGASGFGRRLRASSAVLPDATDVLGRARALAARDGYATHLGIELVDAGAGTATLRMRVGPQHLNFNGRCHGGAMFSLADTAFGIASNSHGVVAAAVDAHIAFPVAVEVGDLLVARAVEVSLRPKLAIYRVDITRDDGSLVAAFTGTVYVTKRPHSPTL